ncbi:MAG: rod shape-determining protein MreC [Paludibacteraceae bacterium]|nr:rod shape-determining protein MreC [Paludibacteraceae bacterium]
MKILFDFLIKHIATIVFIILEMVAVALLYNRNDFSRTVIARHSLTVQSYFAAIGSDIADYFYLKQTNRQLAEDNARLNEELASLRAVFDSLQCDSVVSALTPANVEYTPARIIFQSINGTRNYVIIDRGSADGITVDMGVVANGCAYGVVGSVAPHYAVVLPLINTNVQVSAKIMSNKQLGLIAWEGGRKDCVTLNELPTHVHPKPGDSIFTSSFSSIFPENVLIGRVSKDKNKHVEGFNHIIVNLAIDYGTVRYVAVIRNRNKEEYNGLVQEMESEIANAEDSK